MDCAKVFRVKTTTTTQIQSNRLNAIDNIESNSSLSVQTIPKWVYELAALDKETKNHVII